MEEALALYRERIAQGDRTGCEMLLKARQVNGSWAPGMAFQIEAGTRAIEELYKAYVESMTPPYVT